MPRPPARPPTRSIRRTPPVDRSGSATLRPLHRSVRADVAAIVAAGAVLALPCVGLAQSPGGSPDRDAASRLSIELANDSEAEQRTAAALRRVVAEQDVGRWIFTDRVIVDENAIPHSHPVLTVHTRHLGNDDALLATFLHEQFHWLEDLEAERFRGAMDAFREIWPEVPTADEGGARDAESTWRHLVVCDLELQAMSRLIGAERARALLGEKGYYAWIYARVLDDPRVREVTGRHGMLVTRPLGDGAGG